MDHELLTKYVDTLEDEEEAFWMYKHLFKAEPDKTHQATILHIMEEELDHYGKLAMVIFPASHDKTWSPMEAAFKDVVCHTKEAMRECLEKLKTIK